MNSSSQDTTQQSQGVTSKSPTKIVTMDDRSIEKRVLAYRSEIKLCIKQPTVLSFLVASGSISDEDESRLQNLYQQDKVKAADEMVECVLKSQKPGKWTDFIDALEKEYHYLANLLKPACRLKKASEREHKIITKFSQYLEDKEEARAVVSKMNIKEIIDDTDRTEIFSIYNQHGNTYGTICLLDRMQTHKPSNVWYFEFLNALMEKGDDTFVKEIEPDFLDDRASFDPKNVANGATGTDNLEMGNMDDMQNQELGFEPDNETTSVNQQYITEDKTNYCRMILLLVDIATGCLRHLFYHHIPKDDVKKCFANIKLIDKENFKKFDRNQYSKLTCSDPNPDEYDISLLIKLLKYFKMSPKLLMDFDVLLAIRNDVVGHKPKAVLEAQDFKKCWNDVEIILTRIAESISADELKDTKDKIRDLEHKVLDVSDKEIRIIKEFEAQYQKDIVSFKQNLAEQRNDVTKLGENVSDLQADISNVGKATIKHQKVITYLRRDVDSLKVEVQSLNMKVDGTVSPDNNQQTQNSYEERNDDIDSEGSDYSVTSSDDETIDEDDSSQHAESRVTLGRPTLRMYQLELTENALAGKNTIICSPTGSGKTLVAVHIVMKHFEGVPRGLRKVVFMARTVNLVKQQMQRFEKYLPQYNTILLTGKEDNTKMLGQLLVSYDIFFFTPQILVNNINSGSVKTLSNFSLLILDECHHTVGTQPYTRVMIQYLLEKKNINDTSLPQIVGLTATTGVGKATNDSEALDYILQLCARMDVKILSTVERHIEELQKYTSTPSEETICMETPDSDPCKDILKSAIRETEKMLERITLKKVSMINMMDKMPSNKESQDYINWINKVTVTAQMETDRNGHNRDIIACAKYLNAYSAALEINRLMRTKDVITYLAMKLGDEEENKDILTPMEKELLDLLTVIQGELYSKRRDTENPNVRIISNTLRKELVNNEEDSRAMVFVKARATCYALADFLNEDLKGIAKVTALYGKNNINGYEGMTENMQAEITSKFRTGYYKILVATSVGIEGLDVPNCNIILSYDYAGNEVTKIQMKGRARKSGGKAIAVASKKHRDRDIVNTYKAAMMQRALQAFKLLSSDDIKYKISMYQREELVQHNARAETAFKLKTCHAEDYVAVCSRCDIFVCNMLNIKKFRSSYTVTDEKFDTKIRKSELKKTRTFDGMYMQHKMQCKSCGCNWGCIGYYREIEYKMLQIKSFKFRNVNTDAVSLYKNWSRVPFDIPEIAFPS